MSLTHELQALCEIGSQEIFHDGMDSRFSGGLTALIQRGGPPVIDALTALIGTTAINPEVTAETMRWLGWLDDPRTYQPRLALLERCLSAPSPRVRDGAALGLSFLDDPQAIPALQGAMARERIPDLREALQQVLDQLQETKEARVRRDQL